MAAFVINLAKRILPALLVGSGLKLRVLPASATRRRSPGFIGREWIETGVTLSGTTFEIFSRLYWSGVD